MFLRGWIQSQSSPLQHHHGAMWALCCVGFKVIITLENLQQINNKQMLARKRLASGVLLTTQNRHLYKRSVFGTMEGLVFCWLWRAFEEEESVTDTTVHHQEPHNMFGTRRKNSWQQLPSSVTQRKEKIKRELGIRSLEVYQLNKGPSHPTTNVEQHNY